MLGKLFTLWTLRYVCSTPFQVSLYHLFRQNVTIACEALDLLVTCLNLRHSMLDVFYSLPNVRDFTIDVVLGCPSEDVRTSAVELFCRLCYPPKPREASSAPESKRPRPSPPVTTPRNFFLHLVLEHPTHLWEVGSPQQADHVEQWTRSTQYFEFRSMLLQGLTGMGHYSGMGMGMGHNLGMGMGH